jgi:hypothetical protein
LLRPSCNPSEDVDGTIATGEDVVSAADDDFFALIFKLPKSAKKNLFFSLLEKKIQCIYKRRKNAFFLEFLPMLWRKG